MNQQQIKQLSQIEHVLHRPSMYVGSIVKERKEEFLFSEDAAKFELGTREYVPALIKIFNEIIDNSIDEYVRTKGQHANKIKVNMTTDYFECEDNGRGIPNTVMKTLNGDNKYQAEVAFTEMLSGANYENDDEATIGTNGLGSKAASIFSKKTIIKNHDGKECLTISTKNNLGNVKTAIANSNKSGVHTKIWPDLEYFGLEKIDEIHKRVIKERLLHLSISYPEIAFKFNNTTIRLNDKKYFEMFDAKEFIKINDNVSIAVGHSPSDQFEHFSLVNGLITKSGGTHIDMISSEIVTPVREKLVRKFKTIKPGDIKQKLRLIVIFKEFRNARYTSQTKEEITNSYGEIRSYLGDYRDSLDKLIKKILRNDDVMLPITELFLLKEQAKQNAELKKLKKNKKIKSEKYYPATAKKKYLMVVEGECLSEDTYILDYNFNSKRISQLKIGDKIISKEGTVESVLNINKGLKEVISINTKYGSIKCSKKHRLYVYDREDNIFKFVTAGDIKDNRVRFSLVRSKVNKNTRGSKVLDIREDIMYLDEGYIKFTNNDFFMIYNGKFERKHVEDISVGDIIIFSEDI